MRVIWSESSSIFLSLKKKRVENICQSYRAEDPHFLMQGQFYAACGDVLDPRRLLPATLGTGVGKMDYPSVIAISHAIWSTLLFSPNGSVACSALSIPSSLRDGGVSSCYKYMRNGSGTFLWDSGAYAASIFVYDVLFEK